MWPGPKVMDGKDVGRARRMVETKELVRLRGCFRPRNYDNYVLKYKYAACGRNNQGIVVCFNCTYKYGDKRCKRFRASTKPKRKVNTFVCRPYKFSHGRNFGDFILCDYVYEEREGARMLGRGRDETHKSSATYELMRGR